MNPATWTANWLVPDWPAPPNVRALCTTRSGGVSAGPLRKPQPRRPRGRRAGRTSRPNRTRLRQAIGVRPVFLQQVHGSEVVALEGDRQFVAATAPPPMPAPPADSGLACTIMVADCLPVLFTDDLRAPRGRRACGLARPCRRRARSNGRALCRRSHGPPRCWHAARPLHRPEGLRGRAPKSRPHSRRMRRRRRACFQPAQSAGKWLADLPALARQRLRAAGVEAVYGNDGSDGWCTVGNPLTVLFAPAGRRQRALRRPGLEGLNPCSLPPLRRGVRPPAPRPRAA